MTSTTKSRGDRIHGSFLDYFVVECGMDPFSTAAVQIRNIVSRGPFGIKTLDVVPVALTGKAHDPVASKLAIRVHPAPPQSNRRYRWTGNRGAARRLGHGMGGTNSDEN